MPAITFNLAITKEQMLKYYQGRAQTVTVTSIEGKTIQFPANILRQFVEEEGVYGKFTIEFDNNGKFSSISRI